MLRRYIAAHEHGDASALAALLREDARLTMPPQPTWYAGRSAIVAAVAAAAFTPAFGQLRLLPTGANRQPAAAFYVRRPDETVFRAFAIDVLRVEAYLTTRTGHPPPTSAARWSRGMPSSLLRQFAAELGPKGVRVAWLRTAGFAESILEAPDYGSSYTPLAGQELLKELEAGTMLDRPPPAGRGGRPGSVPGLRPRQVDHHSGVNITSGAVAD